MGDQSVRLVTNHKQLNAFTKQLLNDMHALELMLEEDWFEQDIIHIGAEQEMCLVDSHFKPAPRAMEILDELTDDSFVTELAMFNLEANLSPKPLQGDCFSAMENEINEKLAYLDTVIGKYEINHLLTGILPTIRKFDLGLENMTPLQRYDALVKAINKLRGKVHELRIHGLDELNIKHDSAMLESCNTSFQVHLQIKPSEFVKLYNIAQVLAAPVMAVAVNSPLLFGKRLWAETRVALFQQSIDTRITSEHIRDRSARVTFGDQWLTNSILDMYREDIARFRVMLHCNCDEDSLESVQKGITPKLRSLMIHNSTIYRWNRPCYGISPSGRPHLRIENRVLPSGPTVIDEIANSAFWIGLMKGMDDQFEDITRYIDFDHAKDNFISAARDGLSTDFTWMEGEKISVTRLIQEQLIPLAAHGLEINNINKADIDKYLGIIEERTATRKTGTQWLISSHSKLIKETTREEVTIALTAHMVANQKTGKPVHEWALADLEILRDGHLHTMLVEEFMTTDVITVSQDDIPELVADMIVWRKLKYIPVEDAKGMLMGVISYRHLLEYQSKKIKSTKEKRVKDLMETNPLTISPDESVSTALNLMKKHKTDCLPVVKKGRLIGIITEGNFINITASLLKALSIKENRTEA